METRASYILIGLFTLAVILAAFGFVYWFSQTGAGGDRASYRVVFDGTVSGLRTGGAVLFNGIRVGEVSDLKLDAQDPRKVVATISIDKNIPVRADTRVGLDFQGLTGIASIALKGGSADAALLKPGPNGQPPTLAADPAAAADVMQSVRELASRADSILVRVDRFLADNEKPLGNTIRNIDKFTETLGRNSERLDKIIEGIDNLVGSDSKSAVNEIAEAARAVRKLADNLDHRTAEITAGITKFTGPGLRQFEALATDGRRTLGEIERAVKNFDRNPSRIIFGGGNSVPEYSGRR